MKKFFCIKFKILILILLTSLPFVIINCKEKNNSTEILPENMHTEYADMLFNELADYIMNDSGIKTGIVVEADSINGRLSIALSRKSRFEIYAMTADEKGYKETIENIKTSGDC